MKLAFVAVRATVFSSGFMLMWALFAGALREYDEGCARGPVAGVERQPWTARTQHRLEPCSLVRCCVCRPRTRHSRALRCTEKIGGHRALPLYSEPNVYRGWVGTARFWPPANFPLYRSVRAGVVAAVSRDGARL